MDIFYMTESYTPYYMQALDEKLVIILLMGPVLWLF